MLVPAHKPRAGAPTEQQYIPLYQESEGRIFNLLCADYQGGLLPSACAYNAAGNGDGAIPHNTTDPLNGISSHGRRGTLTWAETVYPAAIYLYGLITEDRRPKAWIERAKAKMRVVADHLLKFQAGNPAQLSQITTRLGRATATTDAEWGGFFPPQRNIEASDSSYASTDFSRTFESAMVAAGGLFLVRAFQVLGDEKYRTGYRMALTCLRRMQCPGKLDTNYYISYGTDVNARYHPGMWPWSFTKASGAAAKWVPSDTLRIHDLIGLEFIAAAKALEGDLTYGDATAVGQYLYATDATLSEMADEAKAFWTTGAFNATTGQTTSGFSAGSYMSESYSASTVTNGSADQESEWDTSTLVECIYWARALRAWHAYYGHDSKVAEIWTLFRSITGNNTPTAAQVAARNKYQNWYVTFSQDPYTIFWHDYGVFDATKCWPDWARITRGATASTLATLDWNSDYIYYDWAAFGLLSPIWSVQDPTGFATSKELALSCTRWHVDPNYGDDVKRLPVAFLGITGMSLQPYNGNIFLHTYHAGDAAAVGITCRYAPVIYTQRDH